MIRRLLRAPPLPPPQTGAGPAKNANQTCFALIRQDDHAALAGALARHLGNSEFARPEPFDPFVAAVDLHDAGWPAHDDLPSLNSEGQPTDVFETPRATALRVWPGGPDAASGAGAWAELLVSLHGLALSAYALGSGGMNQVTNENDSIPARFEMNKFQHREMERQEKLRLRLGLPQDIPLTLGLADEPGDPREDQLRCHLRWLQAMDVCSLAVCCTKPPGVRTPEVEARAGGIGEPLYFRREAPGPVKGRRARQEPDVIEVDDLIVSPWPFDVEAIAVRVPARLVPNRVYESELELHEAIYDAPHVQLGAIVRAV